MTTTTTTTTTSAEPLNPWLSMWLRPRATVRQILDSDPERQVLLLAALSGVIGSLSRAIGRSMGDRIPIPALITICIVFGAIGGIIALRISALVLAWLGRKLGGHGQSQEVRAALAWASVPTIWGGALLVPEFIIFGEELFTSATPRMDANPLLALLLIGFGLVEVTIGIWAFVVFLKSLGEAHGFSAWRALGTASLAFAIFVGPILCVIVAIGVLTLLGSRV